MSPAPKRSTSSTFIPVQWPDARPEAGLIARRGEVSRRGCAHRVPARMSSRSFRRAPAPSSFAEIGEHPCS